MDTRFIILNIEFFIFLAIEIIIIITFFICFKFSRNHGGVFDRRIEERRSRIRRVADLYFNDRLCSDSGLSKVNIELPNNNEIFEVDIDRRIYSRRNGERRRL